MPKTKVICEVSNKHCHLSEATIREKNLKLTKKKDISQPGQWVSNEYFDDGTDHFRVVMPARASNQFELSLTDWVRRFGSEKDPVWKSGGEPGYVVTLRHLHISDREAESMGLKDGDFVAIEKQGIRAGRLDKVLVRVDPHFAFRVHLDTDEGNALAIKNGEEIDLIYGSDSSQRR
jgi:putative phosphotransacetylase